MTFSVLLTKENQPKVIGTLWADSETNARALAPVLCSCGDGEQVSLRRTEDREIPLRLVEPAGLNFC